MERRNLVIGLAFAPFVIAGCASTKELASSPLTDNLTKSLGVTQKQAAGGVGSMLTLAEEKLPAGDFDKVAGAIPGASKYVDMAKSLGAVSGPVGGSSGLNAALGRLGISSTTAAKFVPAVTSFVDKAAGPQVSSLLKSAML
jgi:hypothetical protein